MARWHKTFGAGEIIRDHESRIERLERALGLYENGEHLRMVGTAAYDHQEQEPPDTCGACLRCHGIGHDDAAALMAELVLLDDDERDHIRHSVMACGVCRLDSHIVRVDASTPETEACDMWEV